MTTITETANYAWIIDKDHLYEPGDEIDEAGTTGPHDAPDVLLHRLKSGQGVEFRMFDDDRELYYTGRIIALDDDGTDQVFAACGDEFFGPLHDFGTPNAGAVHIHYKGANGRWEEL